MKSKIHELQKNRKNFVSKTIKTKISILGLSIFTICLASSLLLVSCSKDSEDTVAQNLVAETSDYTVTTLAGSTIGDELGIGAAAKFNGPVCMDYARGAIFVADYFNNKIKKITPTGEVTNYGGSPVVPFNSPYGVAMTFNGTLYVSETFSNKIRAISTDNIATDYAGGIAGDVVGTLSTARFNRPRGLFAVGNELFIVDAANHKIKKTININGVTTIVNVIGTTIGDENGGGGVARKMNYPDQMVKTSDGIYIADTNNHKIKKLKDDVLSTLAGSTRGDLDATGNNAKFNTPRGITADSDGNVYVADTANNKIKKITPQGVVTTRAGSTAGDVDGTGENAKFDSPYGIVYSKPAGSKGILYVSDCLNHKIKKITFNK